MVYQLVVGIGCAYESWWKTPPVTRMLRHGVKPCATPGEASSGAWPWYQLRQLRKWPNCKYELNYDGNPLELDFKVMQRKSREERLTWFHHWGMAVRLACDWTMTWNMTHPYRWSTRRWWMLCMNLQRSTIVPTNPSWLVVLNTHIFPGLWPLRNWGFVFDWVGLRLHHFFWPFFSLVQ